MAFGQSFLVGMFAGNVAKRVCFLGASAFGMSRRDADLFSDEVGIVAAQTFGTATAVVTVDPAGMTALQGYTTLLEHEHLRKSG